MIAKEAKTKELAVTQTYDGSTPLKSVMQEMFVTNLLRGMNQSEAYRKAGYTSKNPEVNAIISLRNSKVAARLAFQRGKMQAKLDISAEKVLRAFAEIGFLDPAELLEDDGSLKPIRDIPLSARRAIAGLDIEELYAGSGEQRTAIGQIKKIRLCNKNDALESLAKHLGLFEKDNDQKRQALQVNVVYYNSNPDGGGNGDQSASQLPAS